MNLIKLLRLFLLILSIMLFTACGGGSSKQEDSDKSNSAQEKIEAYANNGTIPPTVQDYIEAGITGINPNNIDSINTIVESLVAENVDTREELQALADQLDISYNCLTNQHEENQVCISNTKKVNCNISNIPTNATEISNLVTITWINNSWSSATHCEWSCNSGYQKNGNSCEVNSTPNQAPIANTGENQTVALGTNVTLDASSSSDTDGTIVAWEWKEGATILSTVEAFSKSDFAVGTHTIILTVTDDDGATDSKTVTLLVTTDSHTVINEAEAAKFLTRSTFGPTKNNILALVSKGTYESWLNEQFNMPATLHLPRVDTLATKMCANIDEDGDPITDSWEIKYARHQVWWEAAVNAEDQLRQRIAFALSEIMVISDSDGLGLSELQRGVTGYYDLFIQHAFSNFRDLLEVVTIHPAMGDFLSLTRNQKENIEEGIRPDENYAREVLQLFTIGVHELNIDGTKKLDENLQPIPTYNQKTIEEFAKVFTGWGYSDIEWDGWFSDSDHTLPLKAYEDYHDTSEKTLLNGVVSPANKTAKVDLDFALDNIFNHPNVAPFISAQLIQRLVTSNPTPAYVGRVARIFNNNGNGVKGDLKAVVKAILLDQEALSTTKPDSFGKLKEPLLRISHLWRNFPIRAITRAGHYWEKENTCGQGSYQYYEFWDSLDSIVGKTGQGPLQARSVFNFFRPDHTPNGMLNDLGLKAPEFQIMNENTLVGFTNLTYYMVTEFSFADGITDEVYTASDDLSKLDLNQVTTLAANSGDLLNYLNLTLLNNQMTSALRTILLEHLDQKDIYPDGINGQFVRAHEAIILIINSPEYLIQR